MNCKYCGAELKPGQKFCTECGNKVEEVRICPVCGTENTSHFCKECGYDLDSTPTPSQTPPIQNIPPVQPQQTYDYSGIYQEPQKKSKVVLIISLIIVVVIALFGIAAAITYSLVTSSKEEMKEEKVRQNIFEDDDFDEGFSIDSYEDVSDDNLPVLPKEDIELVNLFGKGTSADDMLKIAKKECVLVDDDVYEIKGTINGKEVVYEIEFDHSYVDIYTYVTFDSDKEAKDFTDYVVSYFDQHYQRDEETEVDKGEYVFEDDDDFVMVIYTEGIHSVSIYRSPW